MWAPLLLTLMAPAQTDARTIEVEFAVTGTPQIAEWVEDDHGNFVATLMVTHSPEIASHAGDCTMRLAQGKLETVGTD